jgi:alkanesulfonate monooxygenase SsuD/methylene tetrahydromethanopterin reductase-like flavin-dependent oxidoreductase (luciferase family)
LWFGGGAKEPVTGKQSPERVLRRIARLADGLAAGVPEVDDYTVEMLERFRGFLREYGRDPKKVGVEGHVHAARAELDRVADRVKAWKSVDGTHIGVSTMRDGLQGIQQHLRRAEEVAKILNISGKTSAAA